MPNNLLSVMVASISFSDFDRFQGWRWFGLFGHKKSTKMLVQIGSLGACRHRCNDNCVSFNWNGNDWRTGLGWCRKSVTTEAIRPATDGGGGGGGGGNWCRRRTWRCGRRPRCASIRWPSACWGRVWCGPTTNSCWTAAGGSSPAASCSPPPSSASSCSPSSSSCSAAAGSARPTPPPPPPARNRRRRRGPTPSPRERWTHSCHGNADWPFSVITAFN